jgi:menaquinone-dependent protoporphyrinogen oxidase
MAEKWIRTHKRSYDRRKSVVYAVIRRKTGKLIGAVGLEIDTENDSAELGYWIGRRYWNRGYHRLRHPEGGLSVNTAIVYMTKHGCTEKAAQILMEKLGGDVAAVNLKSAGEPDLSQYDTVIIGGSIYAGKIQVRVTKFIEKHREVLLTKRLGLYLCCMFDGETAGKQFEEAYPWELRDHACATGLFAGELDFSKMNFFERKIVKKVANIEESVSRLDSCAIEEFAQKMSEADQEI